MKKILTAAMALSCALSLCACSMPPFLFLDFGNETEVSTDIDTEINVESSIPTTTETSATESIEASVETTEPTASSETSAETSVDIASPSVELPSELSDDLYSFQVSVNGTVYQFPMWYSDFENLGWLYKGKPEEITLSSNQYTAAEVWLMDKGRVYTKMANLSANSQTLDKCSVSGITFEKYNLKECDWEIIMPKGIQYGVSNAEDIIAAYGDPTSDYDSDLYYKMTYEYDMYQEICFYVYKESGVLEQIEIENLIPLEGADNSINEEVPEVVKNYSAPTELGDDLYVFNVEIDGALYNLPCPVSELLANGFTIKEDSSASAIAAGDFDWVEFRYNNQGFRTLVRNYASYATIPENCFVTTVDSYDFGDKVSFNIPCGLTVGDTEEDLLKVLENYNYDLDTTSSSATYYRVYNPIGSKLDMFYFTVKDGAIYTVEVEHDERPE